MTSVKNKDRSGVVVIDFGSSRVRGSFYDLDGNRIDSVSSERHTPINVSKDSAAEIVANGAFDVAVKILDDIHAKCVAEGRSVEAIASCILCPTLVGLDATGQPLTPVFTWADVRATQAASYLRSILNQSSVHERTGCVLHAAYLPAKLLWLRTMYEARFLSVKYWCSLGDFLMMMFVGKRISSLSVAAWSGMLNRHSLEWDEELMTAVGVSKEQLSDIDQNGDQSDELLDKWAQRWPDFAGARWFAPIGDGAANNVGAGCLTPDKVAVMIATSGAIRVLTDNLESIPDGLFAYRLDKDRYLLGGALSNGGNAIEWLLKSLRIELNDEIVSDLLKRMPALHGLTVLPFLAGERNPGWADNARASIIGLSLSTRPRDIVQAWLEAIAYQYAMIYWSLRPFLSADHKIIASGGAITHYPFLAQIMADVLGRTVAVTDDVEVTSRGVALYIVQKLGYVADISAKSANASKEYAPRSAYHRKHQAAIERYCSLYQKLVVNS